MSKLMTGLGGNTGAIVAGGGMIVALAFGAYLGFGRGGDAPVSTEAAMTTEPQAPEIKSEMDAGEQAIPQTAETRPAKPSFDELRRETDGTTIIAGRAEPLSDVKILVDGAEVATTKADNTGGFAAIASLPAKDTAQVVSLSATSGEEVTASTDEILLAPSVAPPVAQAVVEAPNETSTAELPTPIENATSQQAVQETAEPPRIAVLKSDAEGVSLLNPVVASEVALDTIGYSDLGEVQLTGRAKPDTAKVRVYLDNQSVISLPVDADGRWRGDLPNVDEGVYTLRVDEVNAQGTVSSRVETPFKRESAAVLAQAVAGIDGPIKSITVQAGATLWAIARDRYGDGTLYLRVVEANGDTIRNPDLIYPGQVFDLPN
ncbi:LysM peptidoglycan-binding domain-containing protein [uncultured Sulfitobacter sp.]|uniref:LysM peptidoglycan-binding domain-containing protein n=1 Tax=uncultured Sulfitobacter sp. TaxID=191468 RepID=UPI002625D873|nr:LysM peptidoglycan-binding domain-containing protein [uncultured Sulfitobacter sp.]